ncbi:MAG: NUDIX domain-containing protein [Treponema bryantii]|nr:NUDIX domain-containing protein [Treponema bryantii]
MKTLFEMDLKDYDENAPRFERPSVRGIISREGKIALVHSLKYDYYKFPGGGCKKNEKYEETLIREVNEETGLVVIPSSIKEFGMVHRIQKGDYGDTFVQDNFYYFCDVGDQVQSQKLDDYEDEEQFTLEFVSIEHALNVNYTHPHGEISNVYKMMIERDSKVLEILKNIFFELGYEASGRSLAKDEPPCKF